MRPGGTANGAQAAPSDGDEVRTAVPTRWKCWEQWAAKLTFKLKTS